MKLGTPAIAAAVVVLGVLGILVLILVTRPTPAAETVGDASDSDSTLATDASDADASDSDASDDTAPPPDPNAPVLPTPVVPEQGEAIDGRPPFTIDVEGTYTATIETPRGDIVIELFPTIAPQTVNNFVALARDGFYDGLTWHRVIPGFVAQGGDPLGDGTGGPSYSVPAEFTSEILYDRPGLVAMARSADPDSAGSQFFITTAPAPNLNFQYTIFGEVIEGLDIALAIPERDPATAAEPGEEIISITINEE